MKINLVLTDWSGWKRNGTQMTQIFMIYADQNFFRLSEELWGHIFLSF